MDTNGDTYLISDEEDLQEVFENEEYDNPEQELDFSKDYHQEDGGHIYESIEDEIGYAVDASIEEIPSSEDILDMDFDPDLPESFYEGLVFNDAPGG